MSGPTNKTEHQAHFETAANLLETVLSSLVASFDKKESITRQEVEDVFNRIREYWPKVAPVFEATCRRCVSANTRLYVPDARREDFLTRLVFSRILSRVPERPLSTSPVSYPRVLARGIQANLHALFTPAEFELMNQLARQLFVELGTDRDDQVWPAIESSPAFSIMADRLFIQILLPFRNFNTRRWEFTRLVSTEVDQKVFKLEDREFVELFEAMFGNYAAMILNEADRLRLNTLYGESCAEQIAVVLSIYRRYKDSLPPETMNPRDRRRRAG